MSSEFLSSGLCVQAFRISKVLYTPIRVKGLRYFMVYTKPQRYYQRMVDTCPPIKYTLHSLATTNTFVMFTYTSSDPTLPHSHNYRIDTGLHLPPPALLFALYPYVPGGDALNSLTCNATHAIWLSSCLMRQSPLLKPYAIHL